ncbi:nmrA-like family domain-containing protein 1 [Ambystoma mexicanum]|uniref:nmrA-like family domain-containing protein 1 n=1 Tax=Ambystoma mexicanum TaxID=8296 RepID=UPI0037E95ABF
MATKKVIAVFGATGAQGGSVARALLQSPEFAVRAITRDVSRPAAVALRDLGATVVKGDFDSEKSVEEVLQGVHGAFLVTNYYDHFSQEKEVLQGKMVADTAKRLGLKHVIYSGLENVKALTGGKLEVAHFDGKGTAEQYFWGTGVPMSSVRVSFYYENFLTAMKPVKASDGDHYNLMLPMGDIPMDGISVADIGQAVASIFQCPKDFVGKAIGLSAERLTAQQYAEKLSQHSGKKVVDCKISPEDYAKLGFPGAQELGAMFRFYWSKPDRNIKLTHQLNPKVRSFDQFLCDNKEALKDF